jgi:hypothetical protein
MPSAQDILNSINAIGVNTHQINGKMDTVINHLSSIEGKLDAIGADVKAVQQLLLWGFQQLITLGHYTNQALFHNNQQNDTMICLLQQISVNTCCICNEAHTQTGLQQGIQAAGRQLADLYAATHGEAALTLEREAELRKQIEACCPPKPPEPVCVDRPCPKPEPFDERPPRTEPPPKVGEGPFE